MLEIKEKYLWAILVVCCFLLATIPAWAIYQSSTMGNRIGISGGAATPEVYNETYDSAGYDEVGGTETVTGTSVLNEDYAGVAYGGSGQALLMDVDSGDSCRYANSFTSQTGATYFRLRFYIPGADDWAADFQWITLLLVQTSTDAQVFTLDCRSDGVDPETDCTIYNEQGESSGTDLQDLSEATWYTFVYYQPNDASSQAQYKVDGGSANAIGVDTNDRDPAKFTIGEAGAASTGMIFVIDDFAVCTSAAACGW